ncbi:hypothetical protein [Clostridium fungisolvens]|uniref:Uncharacterized protein n=1 Tax=Clostridium fungisolvens TaxID=1604897 RepID=A0A6V8SH96_9CLOT|nr:hypothetical protein [Clostridium fungisolvens]GFP76579.1 hypothetical protein bsdtw1_02682 [Clostridium fungisolvens]
MKLKWKVLLILGIVLVASFIVYQIKNRHDIEPYTVLEGGQGIENISGQIYVNGPLVEPVSVLGKQIGETANKGRIYEIKGQPNHDWIVYLDSDEMPLREIMRKKQVEPVSIANKDFSKIRIMDIKGFKQAVGIASASTSNKDILKELKDSVNGKSIDKKVDLKNYSSFQVLSDEFKGLAFYLGVEIDNDGKIYISESDEKGERKFFEVGPKLSKWLKDHPQK